MTSDKLTELEKEVFWLDKFQGKVETGFFIRNNLFEIFNKFEKEFGRKIVGIVKPDDWNLELILEVTE